MRRAGRLVESLFSSGETFPLFMALSFLYLSLNSNERGPHSGPITGRGLYQFQINYEAGAGRADIHSWVEGDLNPKYKK